MLRRAKNASLGLGRLALRLAGPAQCYAKACITILKREDVDPFIEKEVWEFSLP
jgi:hypothetical protein